ncbi:hypothetical protein [Vibrio alfacsensis]|uniref:hypothetical protein n=1 Tax=Vibrio alfacsensis TaxID=1074311 RepID=UPI0040686578
MRNKYDWNFLFADFQLSKIRQPNLSMAAYARSRGIPESTFRKGLLREGRHKRASFIQDSKRQNQNQNQKVINLLEQMIALFKH